MKQYIVRYHGWEYDDSHYLKDGPIGICEIFDDKGAAIRFKKEADRACFFAYLHALSRFQLGLGINLEEKLKKALVEKLEVNPTILLSSFGGNLWEEVFPEGFNVNVITEIIETFGLEFYTIIEVERENPKGVKASAPIYGGDYFLTDYHGMKELTFISKYEAMEYYIYERIKERNWSRGSRVLMQLSDETIKEQSDFPEITLQFIRSNKFLETKNECLYIHSEVAVSDMLTLNELLNSYLLKFEEIDLLTEENIIDARHYRLISGTVHRSLANRISDEKVYCKTLFIRVGEMEDSEILLEEINEFLETQFYGDENFQPSRSNSSLTCSYKNKSIDIFGVIYDYENTGENHLVNSFFTINEEKEFQKGKIVSGIGKTIDLAFFDSAKNWLNKYGKDCVSEIKNTF